MEFDADFPNAVDIPIPAAGLGQWFVVMMDAAGACPAGALAWAYGVPSGAERKLWFNRIGTRDPDDAARLATTFRSLGARRVR